MVMVSGWLRYGENEFVVVEYKQVGVGMAGIRYSMLTLVAEEGEAPTAASTLLLSTRAALPAWALVAVTTLEKRKKRGL